MQISRRALMLATTALVCTVSLGEARADVDLAAFMALSEHLTGRSDLDPVIGRVYLTALQREATNRDALAALSRDPGRQDGQALALRKQILRCWYSGLIGEGDASKVVSFEAALLWSAMGFAQPKGWCRGPVGYWSEPPDAQETTR
ncbi:MAG: sugar dehydrogenase complex small subunit [Kiloniellales bacterium]